MSRREYETKYGLYLFREQSFSLQKPEERYTNIKKLFCTAIKSKSHEEAGGKQKKRKRNRHKGKTIKQKLPLATASSELAEVIHLCEDGDDTFELIKSSYRALVTVEKNPSYWFNKYNKDSRL